ncbi:myoneurin isoform X2 [Paramormyrops kingsleyae]|uniref:myoneurin isoform X2 n=1 Tax=Paramormyrops kingsleyae TaxID=1676925 RepID=UPI003B973CE8
MPSVPHGQHLLDQLRKQREADFLCDCMVAIGESRFRAHRNVLAAFSTYFSLHGTQEGAVNASLDPELVNEASFEKLLDYIYTGELHIDSGNVAEICRAAQFLEMTEVVSQCALLQEDVKPVRAVTLGTSKCGVKVTAEGDPSSPEIHDPLEPEDDLDSSFQRDPTSESPHPSLQASRPATRRGRKPKVRIDDSDVPTKSVRRTRAKAAQSLALGAFTDASNKDPDPSSGSLETQPESAAAITDDGNFPEQGSSPRKCAAKRGRKRGQRKSVVLKENRRDETSPEEDGGEGDAPPAVAGRQRARVKPVCSTCGKTFSETSSLRRHLRIHKGVKPYECQLCGRAFRQGNQLKTHVRTHTGEKPYECTLCGKSFAQKCQLVFHCRMHHGEEKPYKCEVCGLQFATSSNFKIHSRKHSGEKPYECNCCGKHFAQASTLTYHMRRHTGEKPYVCDTCGKAFAVSSSLITHARKHTGETPYLCLVCGKTFMTSGELNKHFRSHTGARRADCEFCGNSYTDVKYLRKHIAKLHKDEVAQDSKQIPFPLNIPIDHQSLIARAPPEAADAPAETAAVLTEPVVPTETQLIFIQTLN